MNKRHFPAAMGSVLLYSARISVHSARVAAKSATAFATDGWKNVGKHEGETKFSIKF